MAADGRVLDSRYRLERLVASNGCGEVWQATDLILARLVAVRLLPADQVADADMLARFRAEARLASSVAHRNLARIFDYNDPVGGQPPFVVMEFVPGESLADLLAAGPLSSGPQPTSSPTPSPTSTPSPAPSQTPTSSPSQSPTSDPTPSGSPSGSGDPSPTSGGSPSPAPS
jgi:hypothetical protein